MVLIMTSYCIDRFANVKLPEMFSLRHNSQTLSTELSSEAN